MGDSDLLASVSARPRTNHDGVWAPHRRRLTAGLVLTVTLVAFEALAISTVMPVVKDELGGLGLYGWVFSGFYLGSLLGIVVAGQLADVRGTRFPFVVGLVAFCTGLLIGATAQSMGMLVVGRVVQGFGVGTIPAVAYVSIGRVYPPELRPRVFAVFSTAWVVPSLVGPAAGSALAEAWSWRAVFGALLPIVGIAAVMTVPARTDGHAESTTNGDADPAPNGDADPTPAGTDGAAGLTAYERLSAPEADHLAGTNLSVGRPAPGADGTSEPYGVPAPGEDGSAVTSPGVQAAVSAEQSPDAATVGGNGAAATNSASPGRVSRARTAVAGVLVLGAGAVLAGTTAKSPILAVLLVAVGLPPAVWAFLRLVPPGTIRLAAGLPAAVAARGILTFAFFGADVFVPLEMTDARHRSTFMAGAALTGATLAWTAGSWIQQKIIAVRGPRWLVRRGFLCIALGIGGMLLVLGDVPAWLGILFWASAGFGMGLSFSSLSVIVLDTAEPGAEGEAAAALQLTDVLGSSISIGLGGAFVALGESRDWDVGASLVPVFTLMLVVAILGIAAATRLPRQLTQTAEATAAGPG
jgi:MFS family permease